RRDQKIGGGLVFGKTDFYGGVFGVPIFIGCAAGVRRSRKTGIRICGIGQEFFIRVRIFRQLHSGQCVHRIVFVGAKNGFHGGFGFFVERKRNTEFKRGVVGEPE